MKQSLHFHSAQIKRALFVVFVSLSFALASLTVSSQETSSDTPEETEQARSSTTESTAPEVVVSASRVPLPAEHIGTAVTVIQTKETEQRQASFVHELLREVPSVAVSQTGGFGGNASIRIRGAEANHTLVIIDGLEMGNPFSGDEFQFQHMPVSFLESIEVLRGPQSSIHGSESIGGVVNITTLIPKQGTEALVSTEMGTLNSAASKLYIGTANDKFYAAVTANYSDTDGVSSRTHNSETDGSDNRYFHFKSGVNLTEKFHLSAVVINIDSSGEYDDYGGADSPWYSGTNNYLGRDRKLLAGTTFKYNQDQDPYSHEFSFSKGIHKRSDFMDGTQTSSGRGENRKISYQGTMNYEALQTLQSTTFAAEQKKSKVRSGALGHGTGGEYQLRSFVIEQRVNFEDIGFVSASGRYDDSQNSEFKSRNTYRFTGAWILNDQMRLHGSFGTGVKNPTIQDIYGWTTEWRANPDIEPETSKGWDLGIEREIGSGNFVIDATYFNNKITNLINIFNCADQCGPEEPNIYQAINQPGTSRIKGIELSARGEVGDGYEISAHFTHSDGVNANGEKLIRRPTRIASFNVNKDVQTLRFPTNINFNVQHTGMQLDVGSVELPSYTLANISVSAEISQSSQLTAKISNLFDNDDYEEADGYGVAGRTFHAGIRYEF